MRGHVHARWLNAGATFDIVATMTKRQNTILAYAKGTDKIVEEDESSARGRIVHEDTRSIHASSSSQVLGHLC